MKHPFKFNFDVDIQSFYILICRSKMVERVEQVIGSNKFQNACHKVVFDLDSLIEQSQANDTVTLTNNDMEYIKVIRISFII